ncbi:MAG: phosphoribosyltransferase [Ferruginibacter sp.]|nr:phosphoribosyltransferase [Ferruginibacter sp.]
MILTHETASRKLKRMALEVSEKNFDKNELVLIGISDNGFFIAQKIVQFLKETYSGNVELIQLYLDKKRPEKISLSKEYDFNDKCILLIDDVANSGKTMLYALKPLLNEFPSQIQTMALVERTHKKFPIAIDYVGLSVSTTRQENIVVQVADGEIQGALIDQ